MSKYKHPCIYWCPSHTTTTFWSESKSYSYMLQSNITHTWYEKMGRNYMLKLILNILSFVCLFVWTKVRQCCWLRQVKVKRRNLAQNRICTGGGFVMSTTDRGWEMCIYVVGMGVRPWAFTAFLLLNPNPNLLDDEDPEQGACILPTWQIPKENYFSPRSPHRPP